MQDVIEPQKEFRWWFAMVIALLLLLLSSCSGKAEHSFIAMGTTCSISLEGRGSAKAVTECEAIVRAIEQKISRNISSSEVSRVNDMAGVSPVTVSPEVFALISRGKALSLSSHSAFDIAIGPLVSLWGIGTDRERVPEVWEIEEVLPLLYPENIILDEENSTVFLAQKGMSIDLGGIGKGYVTDRVVSYLHASGHFRGIINFGGNVYALGLKEGKKKWRVALQDPEGAGGDTFYTVQVSDQAVVTSGAYERFFMQDGVRYHHILDTMSGYPTKSDLALVSIISDDAALADFLSTTIFVLGKDRGREFLSSFPVSAVLLTTQGEMVKVSVP